MAYRTITVVSHELEAIPLRTDVKINNSPVLFIADFPLSWSGEWSKCLVRVKYNPVNGIGQIEVSLEKE